MAGRKRTDLIDFITPSRRGHLYYRRILQEAALDPQRWMRHHFIVVFDDDHEDNVQALLRWLDRARETMVLPRVSATNAPAGSPDILRQIGLSIGSNPYVYFQDDDDPLPLHLDRRMAMMEHGHLDAVFGATETITERGVTVEQFPRIVNGRFVSDVLAGQAVFPSYGHPLAALFTRKVLNRVPIYDGRHYHNGNALPFNVRFMNTGVIITSLPDVCRRVRLHADNDSGILGALAAMELAADIRRWRDYILAPTVAAFQDMVADYLESGWVQTFREIATLVDEELGL
ncbi:hypothetical protein NJB93_19290 [Brucella intermedia]|uniref:hypothetical protein n=1 Tax=Brucella intermedia TaxID=94625 RepID=UPI00209ADFDA|nr:hypothetical protein [Brucella intermedia]MCO7728729.1 hypothetical protein [Brucella intermedia]